MPRLDYVSRLDPRNLAHRITATQDLSQKSVLWTPGPVVLDQGEEGACVGFGTSGEAAASPVRVPHITNDVAFSVYNRAKEIDEFEGVDYEGTSVRAGMLVGREKGWWTGFQWATNIPAFLTALQTGPVVIGLEWWDGMYDAPNGILRATGKVVGGHCILVTGYTPKHPVLRVPAFRLRNSWGPSWGLNGSAYIEASALEDLVFGRGGEAAVPVGRKLP